MAESENGETKKRRSRGAGFPAISLPDARAAITTIAAMGHQFTKGEVASYLGHSTPNSGAFAVKLAALRDFGLLAGRGDDLEVSELGMTIAHPESDEEQLLALREAFFRSETFSQVFSGLREGSVVQHGHLGSRAVNQAGVSPSSKEAFVTTFVESAQLAGQIEAIDSEKFKVVAEKLRSDEPVPTAAEQTVDRGQQPEPSQVERLPSPSPSANAGGIDSDPPVVHHRWKLGDGDMTFRITIAGSLPAVAYGKIQNIIEQGDELAQLLGLAGPTGSTPSNPPNSPEEVVMS